MIEMPSVPRLFMTEKDFRLKKTNLTPLNDFNSYKVMADGSSVNNLLASVLDDDSLDLGVRQQKVEDIISSS
jgi:hypothetical protein